MTTVLAPLHSAIANAMEGDALLIAALKVPTPIGTNPTGFAMPRVFVTDAANERTPLSYITMGDAREEPVDAFSGAGNLSLPTLHLWTPAKDGNVGGGTIYAHVHRVMLAGFALTGHALVAIETRVVTTFRDPGGTAWHTVVRLSALTWATT